MIVSSTTASDAELTSPYKFKCQCYNPAIDPFFKPLAHRPSAYEELRSRFCFLGKFDILSLDEIECLAEKLVTLYQDDIEERFSNKLLQFVGCSDL